jgi:hypothetical protein
MVEPQIELGIGDAGSNVGIRREMEDRLELRFGKQVIEPRPVEHIQFDKMKAIVSLEMRDVAMPAEVHVIDAPDRCAVCEQAVAKVAANEAGAAGYENAHAVLLCRKMTTGGRIMCLQCFGCFSSRDLDQGGAGSCQ